LNSDSVVLVNADVTLQNAKRTLNQLIARSIETDFNVQTLLPLLEEMVLEDLKQNALTNNAALMAAGFSRTASQLDLKLINASRYPRIDANATYNYTRSKSDVGVLLSNRQNGISGGLTASVPLFNGFQTNIRSQTTRIDIESNQLRYEEAQQLLEKDLSNAFATWSANHFILQTHENSLSTAILNFERTNDMLKLGQVTATQFREAQLNLLNVKMGINSARYNAKLAEIELMRLSGQLVKAGGA